MVHRVKNDFLCTCCDILALCSRHAGDCLGKGNEADVFMVGVPQDMYKERKRLGNKGEETEREKQGTGP